MMAQLMGLRTISPKDLLERIEAGAMSVFDLNARSSWESARVPGARHLTPEFEPGDLPADLTRPLAFYCSNPLCRKAPHAAKRAKQLGHSDVVVLSAGISGWMSAGLPTESGA